MTAFLATPLGSNNPHLYAAILPSGNVALGDWTFPNPAPTATDKLQVFGDVRVGQPPGLTGVSRTSPARSSSAPACPTAGSRRTSRRLVPSLIDSLHCSRCITTGARRNFPSGISARHRPTVSSPRMSNRCCPTSSSPATTDYKAIDYSKLPMLTIEAFKELKAENDDLKRRLAEVERLLAEMLAGASRR